MKFQITILKKFTYRLDDQSDSLVDQSNTIQDTCESGPVQSKPKAMFNLIQRPFRATAPTGRPVARLVDQSSSNSEKKNETTDSLQPSH